MATYLTNHAENKAPISKQRLKEMVEQEQGILYKDSKTDKIHLVNDKVVAVYTEEDNGKVIITAYANLQKGRYKYKKRFSQV